MTTNIYYAIYASSSTGIDVTNTCNELIDNGNDDIPVNNSTFGEDPDLGHPKFFGIGYINSSVNNGNPVALAGKETETIDLIPVPQTANTLPQKPLEPVGDTKVIFAVYGTPTNGNDVTAICQALINQGNKIIPVNNATLGPDPVPKTQKYFSILYSIGENQFRLGCQEGTNLSITNQENDENTNLHILKEQNEEKSIATSGASKE